MLAVAVARNRDDLRMVGQPVQQGGHTGGVGEDGMPGLKRQICGDQERSFFVAPVDHLEEEVGRPVVVLSGKWRWTKDRPAAGAASRLRSCNIFMRDKRKPSRLSHVLIK